MVFFIYDLRGDLLWKFLKTQHSVKLVVKKQK